jgi:aryl-alcohol dehydrogenase-like predicted oxidoreductase
LQPARAFENLCFKEDVMDRRAFISTTVAVAACPVVSAVADAATAPHPITVVGNAPENTTLGGVVKPTGPVTSKIAENPDMKYRPLGSTGERVSMIGLGGFHLARPGGPSADEAVKLVHAAIDGGITFCDNCWDYNGGESERRLGTALQNGYRDRVFLMTKIDGRTGQSAQQQIDESLQRLKTDHLDLLQFHEIIRPDDPEKVFAPGAALEIVLRNREQGKLRYIGFTGHKSPAIHARMFAVAEQHHFHFDTVQMPLNIMDAHFDSFEQRVLPIALAQQTAVLGMKTFGDPFILQSGVAGPLEMLHYAMSLPTALQVLGIDKPEVLQQSLDAVRTYAPLTAQQKAAVLGKSAQVAASGSTERYKISHHFDGTIKNPHWLG